MTAQGFKYLSPPSAHTVGSLLFARRISTSLSRIAIHKGLSARCHSMRASRTYTVIFVSWALCGLIVEFIVFHYMIFALGINTICFKLDFCLYSTSHQATLLYSSTFPQGCYSQNNGPITRGQDTHYISVYQIWSLYIFFKAMNAEKLF